MARVLRHVLEPQPAGPSAGELARWPRRRASSRAAAVRDRIRRAPELGPLIAVSALLNLWALGRNELGERLLLGRGPLDGLELARLPLRVA